jgi:alkylation response protein AidB-like acyl-CoA dehydrogenase
LARRPAVDSDPVLAAEALIPELRRRAAATEAAGRLPDETLADLQGARLLDVLRPARFGGRQESATTAVKVLIALSRGDLSVGWVATIYTTNSGATSHIYLPEAAAEAFAHPTPRIASVVNARKLKTRWVDGGLYVEEGVWGFNSGVYHAQWDNLAAPLPDPVTGEVAPRMILVPTDQLEFKDDWKVMGMRATGSVTVRLADAFVPAHRISLLPAEAARRGGAVHGDPDFPMALLGSITLLATVVGGGLGALDLFIEGLKGRSILYTKYADQAEAPITHLQIAEASARLETAQLLLLKGAQMVDEVARAGQPATLLARAALRRDMCFAATLTREAVNILASAAGGSFIMESSALNRAWRDVNSAVQHAIVTPATGFEAYGRVRLGLDPENPSI